MNFVHLYHGTDLDSANQILALGLVAALAARYNGGGEFWVTTNPGTADYFANSNPAGGQPVRLEFDLSEQALQWLLSQDPPVATQHNVEDIDRKSVVWGKSGGGRE